MRRGLKMRLILLATLGADIAPPGPAHLRGGHRLLPIYWPAGPQTVKAKHRANKPNQSTQA
jgi:hypothetical protein